MLSEDFSGNWHLKSSAFSILEPSESMQGIVSGKNIGASPVPWLQMLLLAEDASQIVAFSFTTTAGQINTLPAGATSAQVTFNGKTLRGASSPLTFTAPAGAYTFTALALKGGTTVAAMGPINVTVATGFSLNIPLSFTAFSAFDTYQTDVGLDKPNTLLYFGTANRDRIVQYGGAADDFLSVDSGAGNDWIEQYGGGGVNTLVADTGTGNDYIYQETGAGDSNLTVTSGTADDWVVQKGGSGNDALNCIAGDGNDYIYQESGTGNDVIRVATGTGNDTAIIDAGPGNDTITYDIDHGTDTASIDGGTGTDTLTVNNRFSQPVLIQDRNSSIIYQSGVGGTTITVMNIEHIIVKDENGNTIFTWPL
jgi:hypothetical protein